MNRSTSTSMLLKALLSSVVLCACAADGGDDPSEREPQSQQPTPQAFTVPEGAQMLEADRSLTVDAALERLLDASSQKIQSGLYCDSTPRVFEARGAGNLVTVELDWTGLDKGILRGSAPNGEYGTVREGFLICSIGQDYALYSMAAGKFVSAELDENVWGGDWAATLRARATYVDGWERFAIVPDSTPDVRSYTIRSMGNYRLVSAEFGYPGDGYGTLRARATAEGPWERFRIR